MTDVIFISTGELSSRLLKSHIANIDSACRSLSQIGNNPMYESTMGSISLYSSDILADIKSIKSQLSSISTQLTGYGSILNTGPEAITAVDASCKSELTTWFDRTDYHVGNFFADIKTGAENVIDYWVDDYKSKGWSYKVVQSVKAIGKAAPAIIGCAASWAAAPWSPTTWLGTAYAINDGISMCMDLHNIWNENYEEVGTVNLLKDTLVKNGGELSKMLGGDEKIGELIGGGIYYMGEIVNIANSAKNLKSQVIQSDFSFTTVKDAVKETPKAWKGLWDIATNSPITEVAKDFKLLTYTMPNIVDTVSAVGLLDDVGSKTASLCEKGIDLVGIFAN